MRYQAALQPAGEAQLYTRVEADPAHRRPPRALLAALLPHPDADLDRRAGEAERLAQPALDEPPVARLEEAAREQHEPRWAGGRLRREQDPWLLAAAHGVRVRRDQLAEEGVE